MHKTDKEGKVLFHTQLEDNHKHHVVNAGNNKMLKVNEKAFEQVLKEKALKSGGGLDSFGNVSSFMQDREQQRSTQLRH